MIKKINIKNINVANKMKEQKKNTTPSEQSKKSNNQRLETQKTKDEQHRLQLKSILKICALDEHLLSSSCIQSVTMGNS